VRVTWNVRLRPFAERYAEVVAAIRADLEAMTTDELKRVVAATKKPGQANCWWATYRVAPLVRDEAKTILHARDRRRTTNRPRS
jgi:hypothetical protein